jgi:hypothetical protein
MYFSAVRIIIHHVHKNIPATKLSPMNSTILTQKCHTGFSISIFSLRENKVYFRVVILRDDCDPVSIWNKIIASLVWTVKLTVQHCKHRTT